MGESKRRKKLDPTYGQAKPKFFGKTALQWQRDLSLTSQEWDFIAPHFRVVDTAEDVDDSVDGFWIYYRSDGKQMLSFTGAILEHFSHKLL